MLLRRPRKHRFHLGLQRGGIERLDDVVVDAGLLGGDGLLDLVTCEQYYSSNVKTGPGLFRNKGNHRFENVAESSGLPIGFGGLGVAVSDVNNDGWPDVFLTGGTGDHRLYLNDGKPMPV